VRALGAIGSDLYAGGTIYRSGANELNHVGRWNGSEWVPLGSGLSRPAVGLAVLGGDLWVGGRFRLAGGKRSDFIARWAPPDGASLRGAPGRPEERETFVDLAPVGVHVFPNPFGNSMTFRLGARRADPVRILLHDVTGRRIRHLNSGAVGADPVIRWDGRDDAGKPVPPGVYFYRLESGGRSTTGKIVRRGGGR
jgi:hypothetical protein